MSEAGAAREKLLILCVDRDDDVGRKANVETPVVGREANLRAAVDLATADPEEADANALFAAIRLFDRLSSQSAGESYQVATVSGSPQGGVEADRRIARQLEGVLGSFPATGVIVVADGFAHESVVAVIQSRLPVVSIQRVIVKHSERLEESWSVLFRYFKMVVNDPHYARYILGVPGVMLVLLGVLLVFDQLENAGMVLTFVLGFILLGRGFGWDRRLASLRPALPSPEKQLSVASLGVGIFLSAIGCYLGVVEALRLVPSLAPPVWSSLSFWLQLSPTIVGAFLLKAIDLVVLGAMVALVGGFASHHLEGDPKKWRYAIGMIVAFWLRFIAIESANMFSEPERTLRLWSPLVVMTVLGFVTTVTSVFIAYAYQRRQSSKG